MSDDRSPTQMRGRLALWPPDPSAPSGELVATVATLCRRFAELIADPEVTGELLGELFSARCRPSLIHTWRQVILLEVASGLAIVTFAPCGDQGIARRRAVRPARVRSVNADWRTARGRPTATEVAPGRRALRYRIAAALPAGFGHANRVGDRLNRAVAADRFAHLHKLRLRGAARSAIDSVVVTVDRR